MLLPTCFNILVSLGLFCAYSLYVCKFSTWPQTIHLLEHKLKENKLGDINLLKEFDKSWFTYLEFGYQSESPENMKICASDSISFAPYKYKNE